MRFGVCAEIECATELASCGYDYIELAAASDLMPESVESEWEDTRRRIDSMPIRPEVFNSFVRTLKIIGPDVEFQRLCRYVRVAMNRAAMVGGKVIVFGSGGARTIPVGWPLTEAGRQMREFLGYCGSASAETGVIVAIEPLCAKECNNINRVSEGARLVREVAMTGVRNLADTYHMEEENEPLDAIIAEADVLAHVHTADTGRLAPGTGEYNHEALFRALRTANYDSRLSIECSWQGKFREQIGPALHRLKNAHMAVS